MVAPTVERQAWVVDEESELIIKGYTNVNSFICSMGRLGKRDTIYTNSENTSIVHFEDSEIRISTDQFECGNRQMNKDFQKTLKADIYPLIALKFIHLDLSSDKVWVEQEVGMLISIEIAGESRNYHIDFKPTSGNEKSILLKGHAELSFNDFGLEAPEKLFGLIKVDDRIVTEMNLKLTPLEPFL